MTETDTQTKPQINPQPYDVPKVRPGQDYQVAHEGKLINGHRYRAGEILDQTGLSQRDIEIWRDQRLILDIPLGGKPLLPIPDMDDGKEPLTPEEIAGLAGQAGVDGKAEGEVKPKHLGWGKWQCVDNSGKKIGPVFEPGEDKEGRPAKIRCTIHAVVTNKANGHPPSAEMEALATMSFTGDEPHGRV